MNHFPSYFSTLSLTSTQSKARGSSWCAGMGSKMGSKDLLSMFIFVLCKHEFPKFIGKSVGPKISILSVGRWLHRNIIYSAYHKRTIITTYITTNKHRVTCILG